MRWFALLLAAPAFVHSGYALGPLLPDFLPADTKLVIGVQVRRIIDSPLGKELAAHAVSLPQARSIPTQIGGVDFLKDVDEVLIATSEVKQDASGLLVLKGRFGSPSVFEPSQNQKMMLAILDSTTAIAGEPALVREAMARRGKGSQPPAALESRIEPLAGKYDIWAAGEKLDQVDGFTFGASIGQGLDVVADVRVRSAADAQKMAAFIKPFEAMLRQQSGPSKFNVQMQGRGIHLSLNIPEEELKKAIEAQKQALTSAILSQIQPTLPAPKRELQILKDGDGNTVSVKLQGGRND